MAVPLLQLNTQNLALESELKAAFERVLRSGHFILGPELTAFESEMARMIGVKHALGISSGTDAILLALMALGIGPGDEVICPSFTFFATAGCVARVGAKPVFVDSVEGTFNIDPAAVEKKVWKKTKAIIPVHLYGRCAEMDPIVEAARGWGVPVIEDAAQSLGSTYQGRQAGTIGDFGCFSFFPSKNLGGFGDSGLLTTNDDGLAERVALLRMHGAKPKYYHQYVGGNFRMDALQCALLRTKLPKYAGYNEGRQKNAAYYAEKLKGIEGIVLPANDEGHIWNQYTLRVIGKGRRDALRDHLVKKQVGCEIYYPVPMHQQECFAYLKTPRESLPVANRLADEVLSIPVFPELTREQLDEVVGAIREFKG